MDGGRIEGERTLKGFSDRVFTRLLRRVSRSFFLSLKVLPRPLKPRFSVAYLLARATDTIADSDASPVEVRLQRLDELLAAIRSGRTEDLGWRFAMALALPHRGEAELLRCLPEAIRRKTALNELDQKAVEEVLETIVTGQKEDVARGGTPEHPAVLSHEADLDRYTWLVAGCVGEFWARSGLEIMGGHYFQGKNPEAHVAAAVRLGKGLQLVNILRDIPADRLLGRCYLPPGEDFQKWAAVCRGHLNAGREYLLDVKNRRMRMAAAVPLVLAWRTLAAVEVGPPKLSRPEVRRLIVTAVLSGRTDEWLAREAGAYATRE